MVSLNCLMTPPSVVRPDSTWVVLRAVTPRRGGRGRRSRRHAARRRRAWRRRAGVPARGDLPELGRRPAASGVDVVEDLVRVAVQRLDQQHGARRDRGMRSASPSGGRLLDSTPTAAVCAIMPVTQRWTRPTSGLSRCSASDRWPAPSETTARSAACARPSGAAASADGEPQTADARGVDVGLAAQEGDGGAHIGFARPAERVAVALARALAAAVEQEHAVAVATASARVAPAASGPETRSRRRRSRGDV